MPDTYQGSELWNFSLVDPDNRQPVNFASRHAMLRALSSPHLPELIERWPDGRIKLFTLSRALRFRRDHAELFLHGDYEGLTMDADQPYLVAFSRRHHGDEVIVLVPRFQATLFHGHPQGPFGAERWRTVSIRLPRRLAGATLVNVFTQEVVDPAVLHDVPWLPAASAFQSWPVAMLQAKRG
ncbi:MAG: hypothetical protein H0T71_12155 [Acidobacteria bacterium]|nr:hypothetical protein [Acidobacteriota bacterium]